MDDIEFLKTEIKKMFSYFLLESVEFPQCGAYQKAEVLSDVLALFNTLPNKDK